MKPYYYDEKADITIYHGDCRDILPQIRQVDLVLTDPPYPDYHAKLYGYEDGIIDFLKVIHCKQLVFWSAKVDFPLDYTAIHIWDKKIGTASQYERIFERNSDNGYWRVYRFYLINSIVAANYISDIFTGHPSQKPIKLIKKILLDSKKCNFILDPFMGSGTTLVAAKQLGRKSIGIEISREYCDIAVNRLIREPSHIKDKNNIADYLKGK